MKFNILVSAVKATFLNLIYHRAYPVVHILLQNFFMVGIVNAGRNLINKFQSSIMVTLQRKKHSDWLFQV